MRNILSVNDLPNLDHMVKLTESMRAYRSGCQTNIFQSSLNIDFKGVIMGTLFIEPSTRTRLSFESAMKRLGGDVIKIDNPKTSSIDKGESFRDTLRTIGQYVDILVVRSNRVISDNPSIYVECPVINAGDGAGEHPTQALTDFYTIWRHFKRNLNINVAITGDLKYGRAAHSVIRMLNSIEDMKLYLYSYTPINIESLGHLNNPQNIELVETEKDLCNLLPKLDVLYMTRFQSEKANDLNVNFTKFVLSKDRLDTMKSKSVIMHPLPRLDEIPFEIDKDPRAIYFEQVQNGMFVRMALIYKIFSDMYR